jgi:hypothetical protein
VTKKTTAGDAPGGQLPGADFSGCAAGGRTFALQAFLQNAARALGTLAALGGNPQFPAEIAETLYPVAGGAADILTTHLLTKTHDHGHHLYPFALILDLNENDCQ